MNSRNWIFGGRPEGHVTSKSDVWTVEEGHGIGSFVGHAKNDCVRASLPTNRGGARCVHTATLLHVSRSTVLYTGSRQRPGAHVFQKQPLLSAAKRTSPSYTSEDAPHGYPHPLARTRELRAVHARFPWATLPAGPQHYSLLGGRQLLKLGGDAVHDVHTTAHRRGDESVVLWLVREPRNEH